MTLDLDKILLTRQAIALRVRELGAAIAADLQAELDRANVTANDGHVTLIPVMTGSMIFVADLVREIPLKLSLEVVGVSSYPGRSIESKGVSIKGDLPRNLAGKHLLVVDDILDSGHTLDVLTGLLRAQNPASLRTCVLLRKPGKSSLPLRPDYVGFDIPDEFVVGYGLDYNGFYRNLPEIGVLKESAT